MTLELKSLKSEAAALLEADGWTIEMLAVATIRELVAYKGIGRVGAKNISAEATAKLNEQGLDDADRLALENHYKKAPLDKILEHWEGGGLPIKEVALSSAGALAALKGIDESFALRLISKAQDIVNERGLYESKTVIYGGTPRETSPAFPVAWLTGEEEPPPMSIRVRRLFDIAKEEYEANG